MTPVSGTGAPGRVPPAPVGVAVIGAGSWGTALAIHAARAGHPTWLWGHDAAKVAAMREAGENPVYLPGFLLPEGLEATADAKLALSQADVVISAVPSRFLRGVWTAIGPHLRGSAHLVSATKGIEEGTGMRMTEVLASEIGARPGSLSSLSGPSFARELAAGAPTAITLGCEEPALAVEVQRALSFGPLRVYTNPDLVGVELGGALKNVIAIAAGIVDGLELGTNSRAALICRGLKEMSVLAVEMGARASTLMGLAGLGDLVLTCTGPLSRNRQIGVDVGRGRTVDEATSGMQMVAEGLVTVLSALCFAGRHHVELPIAEQVYQVLYGGRAPAAAIHQLLSRQLGDEWPEESD